MDTKDDI